ncbi:hypothetical protein KKF70_03135 [bacterium]|nr:hypothetical protein [bacterium]MBU3930620.1 hypothetical protein [bacterium]MBU4123731.1 hypothetical protein [bacterium]
MKKNILKVIAYVFVVSSVIYSVIARIGMSGLLSWFVDVPSLCWIIIAILFTGLNFRLKDIFTVLLYPWHKDKVSARPQYYKTVLREANKNIFRFALLAFVLGVYFIFTHYENLDIGRVSAGLLVSSLPLLYSFVSMIFVIKPVETAISRIGEEEVQKIDDAGEPAHPIGKNITKALFVLWNIFAVVALFFLITAIVIEFNDGSKETKHKVTGKVKKLYAANWDGGEQRYALVETEDGKGEAIVTTFGSYSGLNEGDEVSLIINHSGSSGTKRVFARIDIEEAFRLKSLEKGKRNRSLFQ